MDGEENMDLFRQLRKEQLENYTNSADRKKVNSDRKENDLGKFSGSDRRHELNKLYKGFEVECKNRERYKVISRIAERVYVVRNRNDSKLYAMKVEMLKNQSTVKQLKRDAFLLMDAVKHEDRYKRHFPFLYNRGKVDGLFNYVIMTFGDYNLNDLRINLLNGCDFSRPNAARLVMQTFQAVHDLHSLGFIHRDISPTKFIFGLDNPQIVYMIGFSLSYHFEQHYETKPSVSPRRLPKLSNRSFRSRSYHRNKEMNRKDDLESWVYLSFNLFGRRLLPWDEQSTDLNMFVNKERLFCDGFEECYQHVPRQFIAIMHNLDKLNDIDRPDYTFIGVLLVGMKESIKFRYRGPFDWQKTVQEKKTIYEVDFDKEEETLAVASKEEKRLIIRPKNEVQKAYSGPFQDVENDEQTTDVNPEVATRPLPPIEQKKPEIRQQKPKKKKKKVVPQKAEDDQPPDEEIGSSGPELRKYQSKRSDRAFSPAVSQPPTGPSNAELLKEMNEIKRQTALMSAKLDALGTGRENKPLSRKKKTAKEEVELEEDEAQQPSDLPLEMPAEQSSTPSKSADAQKPSNNFDGMVSEFVMKKGFY
ncbi:hypothetical protein M3Y96_00162400 [Aphelenchoides besseyi]|nr:hypothetical protein M3Y96_00162400 [Aphelenchoides besseyi]